jgi:hypothetical protein
MKGTVHSDDRFCDGGIGGIAHAEMVYLSR